MEKDAYQSTAAKILNTKTCAGLYLFFEKFSSRPDLFNIRSNAEFRLHSNCLRSTIRLVFPSSGILCLHGVISNKNVNCRRSDDDVNVPERVSSSRAALSIVQPRLRVQP